MRWQGEVLRAWSVRRGSRGMHLPGGVVWRKLLVAYTEWVRERLGVWAWSVQSIVGGVQMLSGLVGRQVQQGGRERMPGGF